MSLHELYAIEKGVPLRKAPFTRWEKLSRDMGKGDSVLVLNRNEATGLVVALKRNGHKTRSAIVNEAGHVRVWAIT